MGCSWLLILGLLLHVAHSLEILGSSEEPFESITAVLGEDMYLSCIYLGDDPVDSSEWKQQISSKKKKRLAGFINGRPFQRDNVSLPVSLTNLTIQIRVTGVEVEGQYTCEFESHEDTYTGTVIVTVVVQPEINITLNAETINGTHYQSVSCSAINGRPEPQISWLVNGYPPSDFPLIEVVNNTLPSNDTFTVSSVLRFPTHLQEEDKVTCVVEHLTLPQPAVTTVRVETYTRPNVTIKAEMVQQEDGNDFWVVSCISSGGRPDTDISLALNTAEELARENDTDSDIQRVSVRLPVTEYGGHNITCVFDHPKFTQKESQALTLPVFYLAPGQLYSDLEGNSNDFEDVELQEEETEAVIRLEVKGNVPRYNVICKKDDSPLPESVKLVDKSLRLQGPVDLQHAGLYKCTFFYQHLTAVLRFNVTVKPIQQVPPTIRVDLRTEDGRRVIECSADDAVPAANMSWLLPEGVSEDFWFNSTSHNGSHSVRGFVLLPPCLPWELTAECVINHPAFEKPENRSITLPLCAHPNITVNTSTEWRQGLKYTKVQCSVDSAPPAAVITWHVRNTNSIDSLVETKQQADGLVFARSSVHFLSSLYAGQNLTCIVKHPSLEAEEERIINIPVHKAPLLSASVVRQQDSHLWLAVCECTGECFETNLAWDLPEKNERQTSVHSEYERNSMNVRATYEFPLDRHEGQNLTCVYHFEPGVTQRRTVHMPRYYISSLRVLNFTTPLQSRYSDQPVVYRLSLDKNHHNQKILLEIEGNVPEYELSCKRSDGSFVQTEGSAMIFQSELAELNKGLYTCWASFCHHTATVSFQVEVTTRLEQLALTSMICISSALALVLISVIILCVCCQRNSRKEHKEEYLSALTSLMQDPGSPEVKKPAVTEKDSKKSTPMVNYSIVIDVKSTV
ncbi:uncharacterized protein si:ch211-149e23.4 [Neolamprologus brichardi]|uniref:uncharacterized protein si:ch211-149e23.4 n=1 Tax=Neolamprologus brichardi TaxID=32507 RepID=UPI001643EEA2|nr:uncharacterized protein si:ch211-149e23.4 [Neolamprologus brichardi]